MDEAPYVLLSHAFTPAGMYNKTCLYETQLNSTQRASMDAGVKTPQCPHLSRHYFISIL